MSIYMAFFKRGLLQYNLFLLLMGNYSYTRSYKISALYLMPPRHTKSAKICRLKRSISVVGRYDLSKLEMLKLLTKVFGFVGMSLRSWRKRSPISMSLMKGLLLLRTCATQWFLIFMWSTNFLIGTYSFYLLI